MPELPEVETVVRQLRPLLTGRTIRGFEAPWHKVTDPAKPAQFDGQIIGKEIVEVGRRAKFIVLQLSEGLIHIHLRMTGRLVLARPKQPPPPHVRARFLLDNSAVLLFRDARKFGRIGYLDDLAGLEARLGPEPLAESFTPEIFRAMLRGRKRQIKPLLLDQSFIAGLGNIYVDEALFAARIHPAAQSHTVSPAKAAKLHSAIREILSASIAAQGTTIIDFTFGDGQEGSFGDALRIFGRQGQPCPVCGAMIVKSWVGQRGTHHCPRCQRPGQGAIHR